METIEKKGLSNIMETSYIDYSMSVIVARAIPDVRDGMKPVQRRVLWAMHELGNLPEKPHRKSARIVGDCMGKYHPHGDSSIYEALVNMAQPFSNSIPLVDGHGNFGSMDGDGAAAMRYTEARLTKTAMELLSDINSDAVDFVPNFDETEKEPVVLPSRFPNLLVNGTHGIAVGMTSEIPPHNLGESIDACVMMLDAQMENKDVTVDELLTILHGPDFPTGAVILGDSYKNFYRTGEGKICMDCVYHMEKKERKECIVITEIPYKVNKSQLMMKIAERIESQKLDVAELRDESKNGVRIVLELKRNANPDIIINDLKKHTALRTNFNGRMVCIVNKQPRQLNLHDVLMYYLEHQKEVVTRRTRYKKKKAEKEMLIAKGHILANERIDEVIHIIRNSENAETAKNKLMELLELEEIQAQAIVEMRLKSLTNLETTKLQELIKELDTMIRHYQEVLEIPKELLKEIREEMLAIKRKHAIPRKTKHMIDYEEINMEDLIEDEPAIIMRSAKGYIKRIRPEVFHSQRKGGKGSRGIATIENDCIVDIILTTTHTPILFFTTDGKAYSLKTYQIPESGRNARGTTIVNLLNLKKDEQVTNVIPFDKESRTKSMVLATKKGKIKRISADELSNIMKNGKIVADLKDGDSLCAATIAEETDNLTVITKNGFSISYPVELVRIMGRTAGGSTSCRLEENDEVITVISQTVKQETVNEEEQENLEETALIEEETYEENELFSEDVISEETEIPFIPGEELLIVTEKGYAKRIHISKLRLFMNRSVKGTRIISASKMAQAGKIVSVVRVENPDDDLMLITNTGQVIRTPIKKIRVFSRTAQGVRTMNLEAGAFIVDSLTIVAEAHEETEELKLTNSTETENE